MEVIQVANNFPAWDVKYNNEEVGLITNFRGEGFACTIKASFTENKERTIYEPRVKSLAEMKTVVSLFILNLKY